MLVREQGCQHQDEQGPPAGGRRPRGGHHPVEPDRRDRQRDRDRLRQDRQYRADDRRRGQRQQSSVPPPAGVVGSRIAAGLDHGQQHREVPQGHQRLHPLHGVGDRLRGDRMHRPDRRRDEGERSGPLGDRGGHPPEEPPQQQARQPRRGPVDHDVDELVVPGRPGDRFGVGPAGQPGDRVCDVIVRVEGPRRDRPLQPNLGAVVPVHDLGVLDDRGEVVEEPIGRHRRRVGRRDQHRQRDRRRPRRGEQSRHAQMIPAALRPRPAHIAARKRSREPGTSVPGPCEEVGSEMIGFAVATLRVFPARPFSTCESPSSLRGLTSPAPWRGTDHAPAATTPTVCPTLTV